MSGRVPMLGDQLTTTTSGWRQQLMEELTGFEYEARSVPRTKLTAEVIVRPTNSQGRVFGAPFSAITIDISPAGLGFLHTTAVSDKFLALTLAKTLARGDAGQSVVVLGEVVRCRSVGALYEVGVKFIRAIPQLNQPSAAAPIPTESTPSRAGARV